MTSRACNLAPRPTHGRRAAHARAQAHGALAHDANVLRLVRVDEHAQRKEQLLGGDERGRHVGGARARGAPLRVDRHVWRAVARRLRLVRRRAGRRQVLEIAGALEFGVGVCRGLAGGREEACVSGRTEMSPGEGGGGGGG